MVECVCTNALAAERRGVADLELVLLQLAGLAVAQQHRLAIEPLHDLLRLDDPGAVLLELLAPLARHVGALRPARV